MVHILVTGANGFVAAHVIAELVSQGHRVTGSVRRTVAGEEILAGHPEWKGKLKLVTIEDYATEGIWDYTFKNNTFDFVNLVVSSHRQLSSLFQVIHVAAPLIDNSANTDYDRDFLRPSVEG
jgi:nucleoside-diphosphate-sugar epimerase